MRWTPGGDSSDVEDRRDDSGGGGFGFGGGGFGGIHIGLGGMIIILVLSLVFHPQLLCPVERWSKQRSHGGVTA